MSESGPGIAQYLMVRFQTSQRNGAASLFSRIRTGIYCAPLLPLRGSPGRADEFGESTPVTLMEDYRE
jgi:hypothetical protein